jgi:ElaB/YqjD/DUF883 family membrane-anchored ribosome-binding protein
MDEGQSQAGPELDSAQERTPEQVREEIERTRTELGDTVAALTQKADIKRQTKHAVHEAKTNVTGKVSEAKDTVAGRKDDFVASAREATPDSALDARDRLTALVRDNPLPITAVLAFAAGVLVGRRGA